MFKDRLSRISSRNGAARTTALVGDGNGTPDNAEAPLLSVRGLKTYFFQDDGLVKAVDGVSFDVFAGKTLGIVGESGCGKSVTARSIMRIVDRPGRIVGGQILLRRQGPHGHPIEVDLALLKADGAEMRAINGGEIGLIFQEPMTSFSPVHTVGDQIVEAIRLHRPFSKQEARARAIELLRQVGVPRPEGRMHEYAHQLSGGLRQRAMIAMALAADPKLLIADEPTTALDVTTQAQILDLLRELQERTGMAIMLITHDLGVIAEMADDVVVMYLGRVVEEGAVDDIFHAPKHPYTRALLRSIPNVQAAPRRMCRPSAARSRTPTTARRGARSTRAARSSCRDSVTCKSRCWRWWARARKRRAFSTGSARCERCGGAGAGRDADCQAWIGSMRPGTFASQTTTAGGAGAERRDGQRNDRGVVRSRPAAIADSRTLLEVNGLQKFYPIRRAASCARWSARCALSTTSASPFGAAKLWRWWGRAVAARRPRLAASCGQSRRPRARSCSAPIKALWSTSRSCRAISSVPCAARCR